MNRNIFQIWDDIGRILPFAVTRNNNTLYDYIVVERVDIKMWPYGIAYGYPSKDGKPSDYFKKFYKDWKKGDAIPSPGVYQWHLVETSELHTAKEIERSLDTRIKEKIKKSIIYELDTILAFGKFKGKTINEISNQNPEYIIWLINNVDDFIINPEILNNFKGIIGTKPAKTVNNLKIDIRKK